MNPFVEVLHVTILRFGFTIQIHFMFLNFSLSVLLSNKLMYVILYIDVVSINISLFSTLFEQKLIKSVIINRTPCINACLISTNFFKLIGCQLNQQYYIQSKEWKCEEKKCLFGTLDRLKSTQSHWVYYLIFRRLCKTTKVNHLVIT